MNMINSHENTIRVPEDALPEGVKKMTIAVWAEKEDLDFLKVFVDDVAFNVFIYHDGREVDVATIANLILDAAGRTPLPNTLIINRDRTVSFD